MTNAKEENLSLTAEQIRRLSSPYIPDGIRQDVWQINRVDIMNSLVHAKVSIGEAFSSPTDKGGAHFTIFSTTEIVSQLMVIYMHLKAGLNEKCREVWAAEIHVRCVKPIRDLAKIDFVMHKARMRSVGSKHYCKANFIISGKCRGSFEVDLNYVMD